jgi:hypothetical protein
LLFGIKRTDLTIVKQFLIISTLKRFLQILCIVISANASAQFTGKSGVYYLGSANIPINSASYNNPDISGVVVRFTWDELENSPDNFNWTFIDGEIIKANAYGKKVSLQPLGIPHWLDSIGAKKYYYVDKNTAHSTYGQLLKGIICWDTIYVKRYKNLLQHLSAKYATDTTVSYINAIAVAISRGLPDSVVTDTVLKIPQPFWLVYNYNADSLGKLMNKLTDYYMSLFPSTALWCSVDYVIFQTNANGQPRNYLASIYCNYGITNYTDRFGLFREDISACNPPASISPGSQWYIMQQNHCRTGAQMLWSVQDGPARMNPCGVLPNTKSNVLDSAINRGLSFDMRYLEIYGADISDASLTTSIQQANSKLIAKGVQCLSSTKIIENSIEYKFSIFPNPALEKLKIIYSNHQNFKQEIEIYNSMGSKVRSLILNGSAEINIESLAKGLYFIHPKNSILTKSFIKQ